MGSGKLALFKSLSMKNKIALKKYSSNKDFYHLAAVLAQTEATLENVSLFGNSTIKSGYLEADLEEEVYSFANNLNFDINLFHQIQDVTQRPDFFDILSVVQSKLNQPSSLNHKFVRDVNNSSKALLAMKLACKLVSWPNNYQINDQILNPVQAVVLMLWQIYQNDGLKKQIRNIKECNSEDILLFHKFANEACKDGNKFLFFKSESEKNICWPIKKIKLFSAYRLKNKSKQAVCGIDINTRYYHIYLDMYFGELNFVYWLKFNNEQKPVSGDLVEINSDFIEVSKKINLIEIQDNEKELNFCDLLSITSLNQTKFN